MLSTKSVVAAAVAALSLFAALPSAAQTRGPVFAAFATVCAVPAADFLTVRKAADAQGWGDSDVKADANMPGVTIADQINRSSTIDKTGVVMSAWHGSKGAVKVSDCTFHVAKVDFDALRKDAGAWLTFPAQDSSPKRVTFRFTDTDGVHKALTPADFDAAAGANGLEILTITGDANGTVLDLMMIKK